MSSTNRTTSKGGKGAKTDKTHKTDGGKGGSEKVHNKENSTKNEELIIKEKVKQLMDLTCRSENEVCLALHENNNDVNMAINFLFEEVKTGEWEIKDKKKKKRQASTGKPEKKGGDAALNSDEWNENAPPLSTGNNIGSGDGKDFKGRGSYRDNKNGGPPRRWREDGGNRGGDRRGGIRGPSRGGGIGRGRGGGRAGGRYPPRGNRNGGGSGGGRDYNRQPIDTWDNSNTWDNSTAAVATNHVPASDDWDEFHTDEWSTEEYTGSLVETKVFTPSVQQTLQENLIESAQGQNNSATFDQNMTGAATENNYSQSLSQTYNQTMQQLPPTQQSPVPPIVGTLTPAQSQYLSQLSQQNSDSLGKPYVNSSYPTQQTGYDVKVQPVYNSSSQVYAPSSQGYNAAAAAGGTAAQQQSYGNSASSQQPYGNVTQAYGNPVAQTYGASSQQQQQQQQPSYGSSNSANNTYNTGYQTGSGAGGTTTYGSVPDGQPAQPPQRTKTQRARVPPPSKIPASAVEMPGDLNSSITYLDVQFGAMDLIDTSFESNSVGDVKFGSDGNRTSSLDNSRTTPTTALDHNSSGGNTGESGYGSGTGKNTTQSSITSALSQGLSNTENIPQTSEHLSYNNATATRSTAQGSNVTSSVPPVTTPSGLDLKQSTDSHSYNSQPASYSSYQSKASNYSASPYNATQTTTSSYVNPAAASYVNNQANSYAGGVQNSSAGAASSYGNSYSSTGAAAATQAYQNANSYPLVTQSGNSYQANVPPSYASNFTSSSSQYNSYNSASAAGGHKLAGAKENSYDAAAAAAGSANVSAASTTTSSAATSGAGTALSSLGQSTINTSKNTATLAKSSTSVMSNIPPGVTPVMSTPYIMGQVPYFPPTVYSYEEMQMLQQRMPHMTTPYYDMGYQTPTTLATVRGDPTGALGGYGAATADGRFQTSGRAGDGTTSPVPAASQQQQQQQQPPILAAATGAAQPYFIATAAFNTIPAPNYAQFGTMYTQLPAVTNAHGSSASSQYGPKPGSYGSAAGYGAYDALSQSTQDYAKGGYALSNAAVAAAAAAQQAAQKGQTNSTSANSATNDLGAIYGKSHAALGKVNSYDKQGFHSGTPPPFSGALSQSAGLAPSGTGYAPPVYIPTMPQHHSTMAMHQPLHQMDVRHQGRRADSGNSGGQRSQGSNQAKSGSKQGYGNSYWNQN